MKEKSIYRSNFELIEQEMIGVGSEYETWAKEMSEFNTRPENLKRSLFAYSRRLRWLEKVIRAIEGIYTDVNPTTRKIIYMLYRDGKAIDYISKELNLSYKRVIRRHHLMVGEVVESLGMDISKKTKFKGAERHMPLMVKREVFERDDGKCTVCKTEENIHYHHIQKFSNGGVHAASNLILLCASCHAEEHKGEKEYKLLKSVSGE